MFRQIRQIPNGFSIFRWKFSYNHQVIGSFRCISFEEGGKTGEEGSNNRGIDNDKTIIKRAQCSGKENGE